MKKKIFNQNEYLQFKLEFQLMQKIKSFVNGEFEKTMNESEAQITSILEKLPPWSEQYELSDREIILRQMEEGELDFLLEYSGVPNPQLKLVQDTLDYSLKSRKDSEPKIYTEEDKIKFLGSARNRVGEF